MDDDGDAAAEAWGDLFAKASEISVQNNNNNNINGSFVLSQQRKEQVEEDEIIVNNQKQQGSNKNKPRRNQKRKRKECDGDDDDDGTNHPTQQQQQQQRNENYYQAMIDSRIVTAPSPRVAAGVLSEQSKHDEQDGLRSTLLSTNCWPSWIQVGRHLYYTNDKCNKFISAFGEEEEEKVKNKHGFSDDDDDDNTNCCYHSKCQNCGQSALYHYIEVNHNTMKTEASTSSNLILCLDMFTAIRNIRCCGKIIMFLSSSSSSSSKIIIPEMMTNDSLKKLYQTIEFEFNRLLLLFQKLTISDEEEAKLLEFKIKQIAKYSNMLFLQKSKKKVKKNKAYHTTIGTTIRLIIDCDAIYYRLYYLQLIGLLIIKPRRPRPQQQQQQIRRRHRNNNNYYIPHPDQYFGGWNYLTQDLSIGRDALLNLTKRFDNNNNNNKKDEILNIWSCGSGMNWILHGILKNKSKLDDGSEQVGHFGSNNNKTNPLAQIWRYRILETCSIFDYTGWTYESGTIQSMLSSLTDNQANSDDFERIHETPAPSPLDEWRDSCRDFICNLYAYATISPSTLEEITTILKMKNLQVVEVGAGTGYIAKLLIDSGIDVEAWDIQPTTTIDSAATINEYHGSTPSFCNVKKSSSSFLFSQNTSLITSNKALLLCYPPPQNSMAVETLRAYINAGGKYLIHIGEFKGLTGNSKFEDFLLCRMQCKYRSPCLSWGTDASHVTIWKTIPPGKKKKKKGNILLPCSDCGINESKKRCRLMRSLVYCSKDCFDSHSKMRRCLLRLHMIETNKDNEKRCLDFKRTDHFQQL